MICSNCGAENKPGRKFCAQCAAPLATLCPACGAANDPGDRFCGECATPLSAGDIAPSPPTTAPIGGQPARVAERRTVSVLFADLVGFTPFAEEQDAEDVRATLTRYFDLASEVIGRYGGAVEKFIGDAVMAVWGAPIAHEDDAERSVRAAIELVDAVSTLGSGLQARAGVLTGEAAVTLGAENQGMVAGDLVNTASRLQSAAAPGTILVGETTVRATDRAIVFEPAGEQALKGKALPFPAWRAIRVVAERGGRNRSDTLEARFVGRDDDLRLLKELYHATGREKRARLVSVIGPAGIGKSRLAWEFLKYLDGLVENVWFHDGRSPAYGDGISFWALGEMVRRRAGLLETDDEATTRARIAATLEQHVTDLEERRWIEPALLALLGFETGIGSEQLFGAWRTFFERLAGTAPVVMVFEDFHFADPGMVDFVDHLLEWSRSSPIFMLTLARPEFLERRPGWSTGKRNFVSVHLEPLAEAAMRELLSDLVPGLPEAAVASIVGRADGVPLYAVETVRMLLADGKLARNGEIYVPTDDLARLPVPTTLSALIASRLDALTPPERALVQDAAVLGQSFTVEALAAVSGNDETDLDPPLQSLVGHEVLRVEADVRSPGRGQFAFVQALIREVAYNTLAKADRKTRHLAAARYFEALGSEELSGALAGHYLGARTNAPEGREADALARQARIALRAAAERAVRLGSHEQALTFLEQALTLTSDPAERAAMLLQAGRSAMHALRSAMAEHFLDAARTQYLELGDSDGAARATAFLGSTLLSRGGVAEAIAVLEPAAAVIDDVGRDVAPSRGQITLMNSVARAYAMGDRPLQTLEWTERLLPVAERLDLVEEIANGWLGRMRVLSERGREARVLVSAALQLATEHDLPDVETRARTILTFLLVRDDPEVGLAEARTGLERAQRLGSRLYALSMVGNGVDCAFRIGEWDWSISTLREWLETDLSPSARLELGSDLVRFLACRGQDTKPLVAELAPLLAQVTDAQYAAYHWLGEAWRSVAASDLAAAEQSVERALAASPIFPAAGLPLAGRIALWRGDRSAAQSALAGLEKTGYRGKAVDLDRATMAAGIAALDGEQQTAIGGYTEALEGWRAANLRWEEALCGLDMAILVRHQSDVRLVADRSRAIFADLGAAPFLDRIEAALSSNTPAWTPARIQEAPLS
jgi:class 3 adenylate cyclase/tetratricopeptide (TPR) repeat protein